VRVVIGEDEPLLREGLALLLSRNGCDVVAAVGDADALRAAVAADRPDVVVTDIRMPPGGTDDGLRAAIRLRRELPDMGVLVFSQFLDERYPLDLIGDDASGVGYLLKDRVADIASFTEAVRRVAAGGSALDPEVVARMVGRRRKDSPLDALSPREREVLGLMAEGKSNQGIAEALVVSIAAVEKHVTHIFAKLDIGHAHDEHRRVMAVLTLLRAS
jgi:DNA-binding NarL/FixJ family response regulator